MLNHTHSDLDELKQKAEIAKKREQVNKDDINAVKDTDTMLVLHEEEISLIKALLFDVLEKDSSATQIYPNEKRTALNILKHMGEI